MIELAAHVVGDLVWLALTAGILWGAWPAVEWLWPPIGGLLLIAWFALFFGGIAFVHAWLVPRILGHA